jgi:hypothetical protein
VRDIFSKVEADGVPCSGRTTGEHESAVEEHNLVKEAEDWRQVIKRCIEDPSSVRD